MVYRASESQEPLVAHSDANWVSNTTIQRRTSGSVALVYGNPVAWKSATQKCISLSAVEAEFIAAMEATCEVLFLKQLLCVRGLAPETQVGLSRYSVTIKLCDSYCLEILGDYQVVQ